MEAEQTVLATLLAYPESLAYVDLEPSEFADPDHALIYETICQMADKGETVDATTVMLRLSDRVDTDKMLDIIRCGLAVPSAVERIAKTIREAATRRRLVDAAWKVVSIVGQVNDMDEAVAEIERVITDAVGERAAGQSMTSIEDVMLDAAEQILERYTRRGDVVHGIHTGSAVLDVMTGGWAPSQLVVVAARPSMGKTAWMLHSAMTAAAHGAVSVIFSLEMSREQLGERIFAAVGRIPMQSIRLGDLTDDEIQRVSKVADVVSRYPVYVDDTPGVNAAYIRGQLRRMRRKFPDQPMVAFVDYLQIVEHRGRSQAEEYGEVAEALKNAARELGITVVTLSQLNRQCEARQNKRPTLSDVRGSGEIEQVADIVMGLYRDAYYNPETPEPNICEVIVLKHRNGPTATVKMHFDPEKQVFGDLTRRSE